MTEIRPELSYSNPYWISKHRYYELKHFCLQYNDWVKELNSITYIPSTSIISVGGYGYSDKTEEIAEKIEILNRKISRVRNSAKQSSSDMWEYLLIGVTEGLTYSKLRARCGIPCCKDSYYDMYRRFFYILSQ